MRMLPLLLFTLAISNTVYAEDSKVVAVPLQYHPHKIVVKYTHYEPFDPTTIRQNNTDFVHWLVQKMNLELKHANVEDSYQPVYEILVDRMANQSLNETELVKQILANRIKNRKYKTSANQIARAQEKIKRLWRTWGFATQLIIELADTETAGETLAKFRRLDSPFGSVRVKPLYQPKELLIPKHVGTGDGNMSRFIQQSDIWDISQGNKDTIIAVMTDKRINTQHEALADNLIINEGQPYDFMDNPKEANDEAIESETNKFLEILRYCPECKIMPLNYNGIFYALEHGADIIVMSSPELVGSSELILAYFHSDIHFVLTPEYDESRAIELQTRSGASGIHSEWKTGYPYEPFYYPALHAKKHPYQPFDFSHDDFGQIYSRKAMTLDDTFYAAYDAGGKITVVDFEGRTEILTVEPLNIPDGTIIKIKGHRNRSARAHGGFTIEEYQIVENTALQSCRKAIDKDKEKLSSQFTTEPYFSKEQIGIAIKDQPSTLKVDRIGRYIYIIFSGNAMFRGTMEQAHITCVYDLQNDAILEVTTHTYVEPPPVL